MTRSNLLGRFLISSLSFVLGITASAGSRTSKQATDASPMLTVSDPKASTTVNVYYKKVSSGDELVNNGIYLIVCEEDNVAMSSLNGKDSYLRVAKIDMTAGVVYTDGVNVAGSPYEITLTKRGNFCYLHTPDGYLSCKGNDERRINVTDSKSDKTAQWLIEINDGYSLIYSQNKKDGRVIAYNDNGGDNPRMAVYADMKKVSLYRKMGDFKIPTKEGYGTFFTNVGFVMPQGVDGAVVDGADNNSLNLNYLYPSGAVVPANTALLLKGSAMTSYTYAVTAGKGTAAGLNYLHGTLHDETPAAAAEDKFYKLSYDMSKENLGFYYGNDNGLPFPNGAGKAYLQLPAGMSTGVKGFSFDNCATGINGINNVVPSTSSPVIYTPEGRKVMPVSDPKKLPAGLYIVNGKKVLVK